MFSHDVVVVVVVVVGLACTWNGEEWRARNLAFPFMVANEERIAMMCSSLPISGIRKCLASEINDYNIEKEDLEKLKKKIWKS